MNFCGIKKILMQRSRAQRGVSKHARQSSNAPAEMTGAA
jgi:hypothetical protein